ncbi:MAG: hypothetical protein ABI778_01280 [Ignavibacteriota bacterium]
MSINKGFIFLLFAAALSSCSSTHRSASISWEGERIRFEFSPPDAGSPTLRCLSCNTALPPLPLDVNGAGISYIKIDEAKDAISSRFRITGSGIDTAVVLHEQLTDALKAKIIGEALIVKYTIVYKDTAMTEQVGTLERQDEVNLFGESDVFYYLHHPHYSEPVVILRSHAVRMQ